MQVTQETHQNNDTSFTRKLLIFSCFLFTSFCFWKVGAGLIGDADTEILPSAHATMSPSISPPRVVTTPIQEMRPGMRVVGRNPLRRETEATIDPTPEGWRLVSVQMRKEDGTYFEAELLRPLSWIRRHQAQPGAVIELNMPELHVVGAAEVLAVSACPPIDSGDGPVVLSTFKNVAKNVLDIYVEGEAEPIGVTAGHPIWSEDRQAFIHSDQLQPGERLRSAVGRTVRITSIEIRAGPEPVYNLEVAGEHVYSVTGSGLLVHNTCPEFPDLYVFDEGNRSARGIFSKDINAPSTIRSLDDLPLMSPEQVKAALPSGYSKSSSWAYSIHDHHFYPKWLGGRAAGPTARVRGFEHITALEPALFEHMKSNIPGLTQKSSEQIQRLIRTGRVTQDDITAALFDFHKARYPNMADDALLDILRQGL